MPEEDGKIEVDQVKTFYALIHRGKDFYDTEASDEDTECAWCHKTVAEIGRDNLDAHLTEHTKVDEEETNDGKGETE